MKMKLNFVWSMAIVMLLSVFALNTADAQKIKSMKNDPEFKSERELIESTIGKSKKDFVMEFVQVPAEKNTKFWEIYNSYEEKRTMHSEQRFRILMKYSDTYNDNDFSYTDVKDIMTETIKINKYDDGNIAKYYQQMFDHVDPVTAMQFYHVERYILCATEKEILGNIPVAGN